MSSSSSRSSTGAARAAIRAAAQAVASFAGEAMLSRPVVLIDGRSGAGKSSLAIELMARWPRDGAVQLVELDAVYPGWDGLAAGAETVSERVLAPYSRGERGVWRRWDWETGEYAEAHVVDPALPLIVEGCGALTAESAAHADVRVWLDSPASSRRRRALSRDGETYRPHWQRWAAQEERHLAEHDPVALATHVFVIP